MDDETLQRWLDDVPFHAQVGRMSIRGIENGVEIAADLLPSGRNAGDGEAVHGGVAATILDSALAFALIRTTDRDWSTVDLRVDYLRPTAVGRVLARATVMQAGRRTGRAEGELRDAAGALCARAVATFVPSE